MSKYDKTIAMTHEEEGTYHRREYERSPASSRPSTTYHTETYKVPIKSSASNKQLQKPLTSDDDDDENFQEWTTSKRKVNHKTRQVETRVSRQILLEDGKVIADSGPQVITRIKEDNKVEECEKEKAPKNKGKFVALENATEVGEASGRVLGEKKEIQRVSREIREENMQYHDERFKELTGHDVHKKAIRAPHELITINDKQLSHESKPRGKMVHYSNKGKKYQDTDEILEVAKLAIDGSITKEVKRTKHHEEFSEDEKPDEKGEAEALKNEPIVERSSRRHVDYVNDFDEVGTPLSSDAEEDLGAKSHHRNHEPKHHKTSSKRLHAHRSHADDEAFPRYQIDPLLNSLRDEDFKPLNGGSGGGGSQRQHRVYKPAATAKPEYSSDDDDQRISRSRTDRRQVLNAASRSPSPRGAVEIPEDYRVSKDRKGSGSRQAVRERSFSPQQSKLSHRSSKSHGSHREDAAVQARLTDEEVDRRSLHSSSSSALNSHEKTTRQLQRQSNANSSRTYYYGDSRKHHKKQQRRPSISSSASSTSFDDPKERVRNQGTRSRDSGFKSPHQHHHYTSETPISAGSPQPQIYSISSKSKSRHGDGNKRRDDMAVSPTPSAGQRSVKTTTTTVSGGLADRPLSRQDESVTNKKQAKSGGRTRSSGRAEKNSHSNANDNKSETLNNQPFGYNGRRSSFDTISLSSLGPNATTIKVPYRRIENSNNDKTISRKEVSCKNLISDSASEMSFQGDLQSLSMRLDNIKNPSRLTATNADQKYFNYKTIVENISSTPVASRYQQNVGAYNVLIKQNSPFQNKGQFDDSNASLNFNCSTRPELERTISQITITDVATLSSGQSNNKRLDYDNSRDYSKYRAVPVLVDSSTSGSTNMDYDRLSLSSSCSLQSSKTYNIRSVDRSELNCNNVKYEKQEQPSVEQSDSGINSSESQQGCSAEPLDDAPDEKLTFDENGDSKKPAAWFFDPRDGSSTAIAAPVRPKQPEPPKVDAKTEELVQARGGRSYYLELIELDAKRRREARAKSIDSLYSRWTSQGALNKNNANNDDNMNHEKSYPNGRQGSRIESLAKMPRDVPSSNMVKSSQNAQLNDKKPTVNGKINTKSVTNQLPRRQLPFSGIPPSLGNRSKSSSCLLNVTKPSRYSIYGGFRRPGENNKPVPRLSYSRAIGPKSQRQIDNQPKTPSRYLKMK